MFNEKILTFATVLHIYAIQSNSLIIKLVLKYYLYEQRDF